MKGADTRMKGADNRPFQVLLTAQEAYPELERQFLRAQKEVLAGFRIFDPKTKLRSVEGQQIGECWADLITDTLNRGVRISLILSDFDPVIRPDLHKDAWESVEGLQAAADASDNPDLLHVHASLHPARVGILPRLLLWPRLLKQMRTGLADINTKSRAEKEEYLARTPKLRPLVKWRGDKIVPRLPPPPLIPVTHHQKLAVFDNSRLYIGGLDLNDRRYDTPEHQRDADKTWHDIQVLTEGPAVQEARRHLQGFEALTEGQKPTPNHHLLRTISAKRRVSLPYLSPKAMVNELAQTHNKSIARAEKLIYLETQFFRDSSLAEQLAKRARDIPDLSLILILPAAPEGAAFEDSPGSDVAYGEHLQVKALKIVQDAFAERLFVGSPAQTRAVTPDGRATHYGAPIIYLHAKIAIFDDTSALVSSANLNGRSLSWDTEAGISIDAPQEVTELKQRCFTHWLGADADPAFFDSVSARAAWAARAASNASLQPDQREGFLLPYSVAPAEDLARNLPGVPDEMV